MKEKRDTILFVCTGNICRSPMAEALFRKGISSLPENSKIRSLKVDSAGTSTIDGISVSENSVIALKKVGIDISDKTAKRISKKMIESAAAIIAMEQSHLYAIKFEFPDAELPKIFATLLSFNPKAEDANVPDPYGGNLDEYENARDEIVSAIPFLIKFLEKNNV